MNRPGHKPSPSLTAVIVVQGNLSEMVTVEGSYLFRTAGHPGPQNIELKHCSLPL